MLSHAVEFALESHAHDQSFLLISPNPADSKPLRRSVDHVEDDLLSGRLVQVLPAIPVQSTAIYVVIPHRHFVPPKVQAFMQHLDDFFQHQYAWYISPNLSEN